MRVAVVVKGYPRLSETFIAQEIRGLERRGVEISIVSLRRPTDPAVNPVHREIRAPAFYLPEYLHEAPLRVLAGWRRATRLPGYAEAAAIFRRDLGRDPSRSRIRRFGQACVLATELAGEVEHIHAHFLHTPASVARYAARMRGLPFSLSAHAKDVWTTPDWELGEKLGDAAWTVACSESATAQLRAAAPEAALDTVYHGLDLARFAPFAGERPSRRGVDPGDPVRLLTVARAVEKKGLDDLLDALAALPEELHWRLTDIGGGPLLPALRRRAERCGLAGRIAWLGPQPQETVLHALREADLFVLPSRTARDGDRDGLPNVLMEAQSQRLPVLATRQAGIPELVDHGESGLLVAPRDTAALAAGILRLARDPTLREAMGRTGEARLRARFDSEAWLDRLAARFLEGRSPAVRSEAA